jgi:predicted ribosome quality control (RQC) complex YloA/Tae2 family protein
VDAITLDHVLAELEPRLVGRHLSRPRLVGSSAVQLETSASRRHRLWLDAGRGSAGVYWVTRETVKRLADERTSGRSRQARLHLRKHLDGARVTGLSRIPGERTVRLETKGGALVLRLSGPAPALTLLVGGAPVATLGDGPEVWPLPEASADREPDRLAPEAFAAAVAAGQAEGRSRRRAVLAACPGLGPTLAAELDGSAGAFAALVARLGEARPTLVVPGPRESWRDADLAETEAVALAPVPLERPGRMVLHPDTWLAATELFLEARRRGLAFEQRRRTALGGVRRRIRRLEQLQANLDRDLGRLADETILRREAEALLALGAGLEPGAGEVAVPDPYEPGREMVLDVDPKLNGVANAERRFEKARRTERAHRQINLRRREANTTLREEREREAGLLDARDLSELDALDPATPGRARAEPPASAGPRHYLSTRGLSILVGRSARENQHLTFRVARPEDLWLHARDVPGSHVVLRDPEGRAAAADLREAGEVAAFFSEARLQPRVDVHATRRKHVRPAGGGPGRVFVGHSETLRVVPRDPEGRLRKR